jgi:hypothetical protein
MKKFSITISTIAIIVFLMCWTCPSDEDIRDRIGYQATGSELLGAIVGENIIKIENYGVYKEAYVLNERVGVALCGMVFTK